MTDDTPPVAQFGGRLKEIADALGISVSELHARQPPPLLPEVLSLLRAYAAINDAQGRQRVFSLAQREAARCQALDGPQS